MTSSLGRSITIFAGSILLSVSFGAGAGPRLVAQTPQDKPASASSDPWWKHALIYEIYPRSFQDSNGDGIGDLNGITQRLDYLKALGVDAIWISPMYPSPQIDFGYDISNYEGIDPQYGTMADFDRLVAEARKRNIRIVLDMVMNHTSDKHPWFIESRSSKTNPKRDWYVWRDGKGPGTPPNNWGSIFGHSAWQFDPKTGQWYYHAFYVQQPDLNWRNPAVEKAMFGVIRFWLDKGVAGFRFDAIPQLLEDESLKDEKVVDGTNAYGDAKLDTSLTENLPEVHDIIRRLRKVSDAYPGQRLLIGETYLPNVQELDKWYGGTKHDELQLPMDMKVGFVDKLDVATFRARIDEAEHNLDGNQPLFVFDNHDNERSLNRYGDGRHDLDIARVLATMLFATRSTALMYYGEELGMTTSTPARVEDVKDPIGITGWPKEKGRDGERTPMQWNDTREAGFTTSDHPWLPLPASAKTVNVADEVKDPDSLLNWYKMLIALRRSNPTMHSGTLTMINASDNKVLAWQRQLAGHPRVVIACNFTADTQTVVLPGHEGLNSRKVKTLVKSPGMSDPDSLDKVELKPFGVYVGEVQ